jgi:hypothetical protein
MSTRSGQKSFSADSKKRQVRSRKAFGRKQIRSRTAITVQATADVAPPYAARGEFVKRVKVGRLRTVANWRREISRVYRQMRRGEIPPELGTKLAFVARLGMDAAKGEEEIEQLKSLNARYDALLHGTPLPALPATTVLDQDGGGQGDDT